MQTNKIGIDAGQTLTKVARIKSKEIRFSSYPTSGKLMKLLEKEIVLKGREINN